MNTISNYCRFIGRLTGDPKLIKLESTDLLTFTLAVSEYRREKNGDKKKTVNFLDFEAWDSGATTLNKYFFTRFRRIEGYLFTFLIVRNISQSSTLVLSLFPHLRIYLYLNRIANSNNGNYLETKIERLSNKSNFSEQIQAQKIKWTKLIPGFL